MSYIIVSKEATPNFENSRLYVNVEKLEKLFVYVLKICGTAGATIRHLTLIINDLLVKVTTIRKYKNRTTHWSSSVCVSYD